MEDGILESTKKLLGLAKAHTAFDSDITMFINSAFSSLSQIGVSSETTTVVDSYETKWSDLGLDDNALSQVKTYVYLKVRLLFDPPATSYAIEAMEKQAQEIEWRLSEFHDDTQDETFPPVVVVEEVV